LRPAKVQQPAIPHQKQDENAPNKVVYVQPAHRYKLQTTLVVHDPVNQNSHSDKRNKKRNRRKEHALSGPVRNCRANQVAQSCQLQKDKQHNDDKAYKCKQKMRAISGYTFGHTLLNHPAAPF